MIGLPILPDMQCDRYCGECCTMTACTEEEYTRIKQYAKRHRIKPIDQGMQCPWYQEGRCSVYPVRPVVCRIYGHFAEPNLTCPRGYNTNLKTEQRQKCNEFLDEYKATRLLHEILPIGLAGIKKLLAENNSAVSYDV